MASAFLAPKKLIMFMPEGTEAFLPFFSDLLLPSVPTALRLVPLSFFSVVTLLGLLFFETALGVIVLAASSAGATRWQENLQSRDQVRLGQSFGKVMNAQQETPAPR